MKTYKIMTLLKSSVVYILLFISSIAAAQVADLSYEKYVKQLKKIPVNGGSLSYLDQGKGEDVFLMLHGVPTSSWLYRKISDSLINHNKRVIAPDLLGYGASDKPDNDDSRDTSIYHPKKQAERVFALMDSLNIKSWTLVCHDMGSLVAWKMLDLDKDNQINKLIVLNSILEKDGFKPPLKFKEGFMGRMYAKLYCSNLGKGIVKKTMNNGLYEKKINKKALHGYVKPLKKSGHHALYTFFTTFDEMHRILKDNPKRFNDFKNEILFVWGVHDDILTVNQVDKAMTWTENAEKFVLSKGSHFIQEQYPEEIVNILIK